MARELVTISLDEREYVPQDWKDEKGNPEEGALKFKFKPLSKRKLAQFNDNSSRLSIATNTLLLGNAENSLLVFRSQVTGWENLVVDKKKVSLKKDANGLIDEELLDTYIPLDIIEEVASHIIKVSKFPEDEKGK